MKKAVDKLSIYDFYEFPVWTWAEEDDESMVVPWESQDSFENHDAFFVMAVFFLNDGTQSKGFIGVRAKDFYVYLISISDENGNLKDLSLQEELTPLQGKEIIAKHLNKPMEAIFPMKYYATNIFSKEIKGIIL